MQRVQTFILVLIAVFCALSYSPLSYTVEGTVDNSNIVLVLFALMAVLSVFSIKSFGFSNHLIKTMFWSVLFITLLSIIFNSLSLNVESTVALAYFQVYIGVLLGYNISINTKQLNLVLRVYMIASLLVGAFIVWSTVGGIQIVEQYLVAGKNASGVMVALSSILAFYFARADQSKIMKIIDYGVLVALLVELLVFRARLATLSVGFIILIYLYKEKSFKLIGGFLAIILILLLFSPTAESFIYDSFFMNKESDITSGRGDLSTDAWMIILNSPLIGNLHHDFTILDETYVHNYLLKVLSDYGLFLSFPWVFIYCYLGVFCLKRINKINHSRKLSLVSYLLFAMLFVESMGEYSYPFSPGTITFIPFLLIGYAERIRYSPSSSSK